LVRGLDYYCHTVFEFQSSLLGSQDSFGGGGRYDGLFEQLGGNPTPAVGFALGVERMLLILEESGKLPKTTLEPKVYVCVTNPDLINFAIKISENLRSKQISAIVDLQRRSMKAQMREANKLNAKFVIFVGENEIEKGIVNIKNMALGEQFEVEIDKISEYNFE
jgi:histidyl-tRNA synthetase